MKNFTISILFISVTWILNAQNNTYIGIEIGVTNDRFEYFDDGEIFVTVPLNNLRLGVLVGHSFNNYLSIETGFVRKNYTEGFGFELPRHSSTSTSSSIRTWQIPFRIKPRVNFFSDNLFFTPTIGFHYCINRDHLFRNERSSLGSSNFVTYSYNSDYTRSRTFPLLETGLGIELNIFSKARINFYASYFTGFKEVIELDMIYNVFDGPDIMLRGHSKGDYINVSLGVHYPIIGRFK